MKETRPKYPKQKKKLKYREYTKLSSYKWITFRRVSALEFVIKKSILKI